MSHNHHWDYKVSCQECGHEEMSKRKDVYRCRFCGSKDIDVDDGWDDFLKTYQHRYEEQEENGLSE